MNSDISTKHWEYRQTTDPDIPPNWRHMRLEIIEPDPEYPDHAYFTEVGEIGTIIARLPDGAPEAHAQLLAAAPKLLRRLLNLLGHISCREEITINGRRYIVIPAVINEVEQANTRAVIRRAGAGSLIGEPPGPPGVEQLTAERLVAS